MQDLIIGLKSPHTTSHRLVFLVLFMFSVDPVEVKARQERSTAKE